MTRKLFISIAAVVGFSVGLFALFFPNVLLLSKGVAITDAVLVWTREVGVLLMAVSFMTFLIRSHPDSPTLKYVLLGNALLQIGLFPIEIIAYLNGTITQISGIIPNTLIHFVFAICFLYYFFKIKNPRPA